MPYAVNVCHLQYELRERRSDTTHTVGLKTAAGTEKSLTGAFRKVILLKRKATSGNERKPV